MKNTYYAHLVAALLCVLLIVPTSSAKDHFVKDSPVGLTDQIRMSDLVTLKQFYMAPAVSAVQAASIKGSTTLTTVAPPLFSNMMPQEGQQTAGIGLAYGAEVERLGVQIMYMYMMTATIALGGDFTLFFPEKIAGTTLTYFTLNVLAFYYFYATETLRAYGLGGLNFLVSRFSNDFTSGSNSELGLNLGGGIEYAMAAGFLYAQLKYVIGDFDQLVLSFGYRHILGN